MADAKQQDPIIKRAKVKGTGLPIDGHTLTFGFWAYDGHKQPHLLDWEKESDDAVMRTMHQTDELYSGKPNAENISNSTVVQANKAETIHVENKVQINSNNGGGDE